MKRAEMVNPGDLLWVVDFNGSLKLIQVDHIYWDTEPDLEGWNIIYDNKEYFLECCYSLEFQFCEN